MASTSSDGTSSDGTASDGTASDGERRRVVVTGLGVVAPCGTGAPAFWEGLLRPPPPGRVHALDDFEPGAWFESPKHARRADRFTHLAIAAAQLAVEDAGGLADDPDRSGVLIGTGIGGLHTLEAQVEVFRERGASRVSPFMIPMLMPNAAAAAVSLRYGLRGPCEATVTACAAGTQSIANAASLIRSGRVDNVLTGSTEAALTETGIAGFTNMTAMTNEGISRPFDAQRDGFVIAEGAGVLVLESLEAARQRGATVHAEIMGGASTADAHHITAPPPDAYGAVSCMRLAIADAGLGAEDITAVNAHGTSTPLNDAAEASAIVEVLGERAVPVTSIKGVTGHSLAAAGALEAVSAVQSMHHGYLPPTANHKAPEAELAPIDVVTGEGRDWTPGPMLSNSFGFGGHNGCLVIGPPPS